VDLSIFPNKSNYLDLNEYHLALALWYGEHGFFVFPCHGKIACVRWSAQSASDAREIERLWRRHADAVPAIDLARSNAFVLDCDREGEGHDLNDGLAWAIARSPSPSKLDAVPGSVTPSAGRHLVWRNCEPPLGCGRGTLPPKSVCNIDPKGNGGYIIAPGSDTSPWGGGYYRPVGDLTALPELPEWVRGYIPVRGAPTPPPKPQTAAAGSPSEIQGDRVEVEVEPLVIDSYLERALNADNGTDDDGILVLIRRTKRFMGLNNVINAQSHKLGVHVAAGRLTMGQAYVLISQACEQAHQLPADDKAYGADGTIMRGLRAGVASKAAERVQRERDADEGNVFPIRLHRGGGGGASPEPKSDFFDFGLKPGPKPLVAFKPYVRVDPATIPMRPWVYGRILMRRTVSLLVAPGGIGKSSLTITEALAQTSGKPLLGPKPRGRLRVLLWGLEEDADEIMRRVEAACLKHELPVEDTDGYLFIPSDDCAELITATSERGGIKIMRPLIDAICAEIIAKAIDVVVIDPFVSSHEVPENDNVMQNRIIKEWVAVAKRCNCAVQLVDHTRKLGPEAEVGVESTRGAKAKTDAARLVRSINQMTGSQADSVGIKNPKLYFRTDRGKSNYTPPADSSDWFELKSVSLKNDPEPIFLNGIRIAPDDDDVGVVTAWKYPDALEGVSADIVAKLVPIIRKGKYRASQNSKSGWIGEAVAQVMGLDVKKDKRRINRMVQSWLASGFLTIVVGKDGNRNKRQFIKLTEDLTEADVVAGSEGEGPEEAEAEVFDEDMPPDDDVPGDRAPAGREGEVEGKAESSIDGREDNQNSSS
jgi:hypothetical protein